MNEFNCSMFLLSEIKIIIFSFKSLSSAMISSFKFIMKLIDNDKSINVEKQAKNDKIN